MSKSLYVRRLTAIKEELPNEVLSLEELEKDGYSYFDLRNGAIPAYIQLVGTRKRVWTQKINFFNVIEKLTGQKIMSFRWLNNGDLDVPLNADEHTIITKEQYTPFYYRDEFDVYLYNSDTVATSDATYLLKDIPQGVVDTETIEKLIKEFIESYDDDYTYGYPLLYALEKAKYFVEQDEVIVFDIG